MIPKELRETGVVPKNNLEYGVINLLDWYACLDREYRGDCYFDQARKLSEQSVPLLVVSNHIANLDGPEVYKTLDLFGIGKEPIEIAGWKLKRRFHTRVLSNSVPTIWVVPYGLEPESKKEEKLFDGMNSKAFHAASIALRKGHPLVLFVEGTRSRTGQLQQPPEAVAAYYHLSPNLHILPISLMGTDSVMPVGSDIPIPRRNKKVIVAANPIITPQELHMIGKSVPFEQRKRAENNFVMMRIAGSLSSHMQGAYGV